MRMLVLFGCLPGVAWAQTPTFEVASIRLGGDTFSTRPQISGSRFLWTTQVAHLIGYAYDLDPSNVSSTSRVFGGGEV